MPTNFGKAFDLGALRNPVAEEAIYGIALTQKNLMEEFLPASNQIPVIVVCWSSTSKQSLEAMAGLGKLFEEVASLGGETPWLLGNLNVDREQAVVKALHIPAVPFAIALIGEQLVPLFETLPTPEQLRLVVNRVIELAATRGIGVAPTSGQEAEPEAPKLEAEEERALGAIEAGDLEGAKAAYQAWLNRAPANQMASLGLAQVELLMRIKGLDAADIYTQTASNPDDLLLATQAADFDIAAGNYEGAFTRLINYVRTASGDEKRKAREHLVALFALVDPSDPGLAKARQQLASALF